MNTPPTDRPKGSSLQPLRALLPFLRPIVTHVGLALALLVAAAAMLVLPQALKNVIDRASPPRMRLPSTVFPAAAGRRGCLRRVRDRCACTSYWIGERVVADLRRAVYRA